MTDDCRCVVSLLDMPHCCDELADSFFNICPFQFQINCAITSLTKLKDIITARTVIVNQTPVNANLLDEYSLRVVDSEFACILMNYNVRCSEVF